MNGVQEGERQAALKQLLQKWLSLDLVTVTVSGKTRLQLKARQGAPSMRQRARDWGMKPATVNKILTGKSAMPLEFGLRLLREVQPPESEIRDFLKCTRLDSALDDVSNTFKQAGFQSALTRITNLVWGQGVAQLSETRREEGRRALHALVERVRTNRKVISRLEILLEEWLWLIDKYQLPEAYEKHGDFHEKLSDMLGMIKFRTLMDADKHASDLSRELRVDPTIMPTGINQGYSSVEEAMRLFLIHENLVDAVISGDLNEIDRIWDLHSDWRLPLASKLKPRSRKPREPQKSES